MVNVFLHGEMEKLFGGKWILNISSPAEAIHAININTKGAFKKHLIDRGLDKEYIVKVGENSISKDYLIDKTTKDIHILPKIEGSDEVVQTIVGVVLIVVGAYFGQGWLVQIGASLVIGGVAQMLTPTPKTDDQQGNASRTIQGVGGPIRQGAPVPLVYGKMIVEPFPISTSLSHYDKRTIRHIPDIDDERDILN